MNPTNSLSEHVSIAVLLVDQAAIAIQNAWLFDQLREGRNRLQVLSRRLVEIQESERKYIARELHDEASQALVGLKFILIGLREHPYDPNVVVSEADELETRIHEILDNLHRLASNLRPASLDHLGFVPALRQFIDGINGKSGITVELRVEGPLERLQQNTEINLYRIVQEALNNTIHHARASRAEVYLRKSAGCLTASIMDDGIGFDPAAVTKGDRLGLFGMRERAEMIGGNLSINSIPGEGTTIFVEIPDDH